MIALNGFAFGLSLIVAIGAQNAFVLRQGLRGAHVLLVVAICAGSDAVLIAAGVGGLGVVISHAPVALTVIRWLGSALLLVYGALAARRAWRGGSGLETGSGHGEMAGSPPPAPRPLPTQGGAAPATEPVLVTVATTTRVGRPGRVGVLLTCVALTWLNPHVYLDTVLLLGSVAQRSGSAWQFAIGAMLASVVWFTALGFGARSLRPVFARPVAWRVLDGLIALTMVTIAVRLLLG